MEKRILWVAFLALYFSWTVANARKIVTFEHSGPLMITQEISDLGEKIVVSSEDVQELLPRISILKERLSEGLLKMSLLAPYKSGFPLGDAVSMSGESLAFQWTPSQLVCNACIEVSKQAEEVLSDPQTLAKIEELATSICTTLPSNFSTQCDEMAKTYIEETITMLQDYLSKDNLCISTGLCTGNSNIDSGIEVSRQGKISPFDVDDDTTCAACEQFIEQAISYASQNKTQSEFISLLHQTCSKLKIFSTECGSLVDYYASLLFTEVQTVNAKEFCQKISICGDSASLFLKQEQNCDLCRAAVLEIRSELEDPETKLKVIEMMLDNCKRVPAYAKECKKLVFEYGPIILTNMEKYLESNDVCSEIHVCETLAGKVKSNMDFSSLPVIELPSSGFSNHANSE